MKIFNLATYICAFFTILISCDSKVINEQTFTNENSKLVNDTYWVADSFFLVGEQNIEILNKLKEKLRNEITCTKFEKNNFVKSFSCNRSTLKIYNKKVGNFTYEFKTLVRKLDDGIDSVEDLTTRIDTITDNYFIEYLDDVIGIRYIKGNDTNIIENFKDSNFDNFKNQNREFIIKEYKWKLAAIGYNSNPLRKYNAEMKKLLIQNEFGNFPEKIEYSQKKMVLTPIENNKYHLTRHNLKIENDNIFFDIDKEYKNFYYKLENIGVDSKFNQFYNLDLSIIKFSNNLKFVYESTK